MHKKCLPVATMPWHSSSIHRSSRPPGNQESPSDSLGAEGGVYGCSPERLHLQGAHCILHEDPGQRSAQRWDDLFTRSEINGLFPSFNNNLTSETSL